MGSGNWTSMAYNTTIKNMGFSDTRSITSASVQTSFSAKCINPQLNPLHVCRECIDTTEHPNTIPIMLCVDCTGSMGTSMKNCFAKLDETITSLLNIVPDVEICVAGIGDFAYDVAPFQVSQYESDNRILDWLLKIWQERGGGGNRWESYTAPWYFGIHHTKLDCWARGKKGIIITLGDEGLNSYLPCERVNEVFGDNLQGDVDTSILYQEASKKFDIYHIAITDKDCSYKLHESEIEDSCRPILQERLFKGNSSDLPKLISAIVTDSINSSNTVVSSADGISW